MPSPEARSAPVRARLAGALTLVLAACSSQDDAPSPPAFTPCVEPYAGECATIPVPLDWSAPDGKTIGVQVNRLVAAPQAKRQIWLVQGGPGVSVAKLTPLAQLLEQNLGDVEVVMFEHRGVGASGQLACDAAELESSQQETVTPDLGALAAKCLAEVRAQVGDDLRFYTTTNAARDLERAIARVRRDGQQVFILAFSYGTDLVQRYLQIAPNQAAGVILDSVVPPGTPLSTFDQQGDPVGKRLAELCKQDATCSGAMGPDPWAFMVAAKQKLVSGHCPEAGLEPKDRMMFTDLLRSWPDMGMALAAWARFDRCSAEDAAALRTLKNANLRPLPLPGSRAVYFNIVFSELWESPPPPRAVLQQRFDDAVFPSNVLGLADAEAIWPKYPRDAYWGKYPDVTIPMLLLNGDLDTQTPIEASRQLASHYARPGQSFVEIPHANHGTITSSPLRGGTSLVDNAGFQIIHSFLENPGRPELSWTTQVDEPKFDSAADLGTLFGTDTVF